MCPSSLYLLQHELYDGNSLSTEGLPHDIALLETTTPMVFNEYVEPACLPGDADLDLVDNNDCWITGWGLTKGKRQRKSHYYNAVQEMSAAQ